jgi:hypothetical protein
MSRRYTSLTISDYDFEPVVFPPCVVCGRNFAALAHFGSVRGSVLLGA